MRKTVTNRKALTRGQRWVAAIGAALALSSKGVLIVLLIFAVIAAFRDNAPAEPDRRTLLEYVVLLAALTALATIPVPVNALN